MFANGEINNIPDKNIDNTPDGIREKTRQAIGVNCFSRSNLIPLLLQVQGVFGYLPREAIMEVAKILNISAIEVYSVATFYHHFRFNKPGRKSIKVCTGTACHCKGSSNIMDLWKKKLGINKRETTHDGEFDLDGVPCVGCCVMAPVVTVDGEIYGKCKPAEVENILLSSGWRSEEEHR